MGFDPISILKTKVAVFHNKERQHKETRHPFPEKKRKGTMSILFNMIVLEKILPGE